MPWYRITLLLRNGKRKSGVRQFPGHDHPNQVKAYVWNKVDRWKVEDVEVVELPACDPEVVNIILKRSQK